MTTDAPAPAVSDPQPTIAPGIVREVEAQHHRDDIELTIASPEDYPEIEAASRGADPAEVRSPLTADLIRWFNDTNPCGQGFVVIARDPDTRRIAGHFVFYPWRLRQRTAAGEVAEIPVYLHIRLWVSSEFRRRGIFLSMTSFGLELLRRVGIGFVYTVPNPRSAPGFLKLGEQHAGDVPFWIRPLFPGWGWLAAGPRARDVEVERREGFDDRFDDAPDSSLPEGAAFWSPRRRELLDWRYTERPDLDYEIRYLHREGSAIGYLVTRRMRIGRLRTVVVCDFWAEPSGFGALRIGLEDAVRSGGRAHVAVAMGGNVAGTTRRAFRRAGFVRCPKALLPQPVSVIGGGMGEGEDRIELPAFDAWYLTPCDWDVF